MEWETFLKFSFGIRTGKWKKKEREREKKGKKEIVEKFVTTFYVHKSFMKRKKKEKTEKFVELIHFAWWLNK